MLFAERAEQRRRAVSIELARHVVEKKHGPNPARLRDDVDLAELERENDGTMLALRRHRADARVPEAERELVAMGADRGGPLEPIPARGAASARRGTRRRPRALPARSGHGARARGSDARKRPTRSRYQALGRLGPGRAERATVAHHELLPAIEIARVVAARLEHPLPRAHRPAVAQPRRQATPATRRARSCRGAAVARRPRPRTAPSPPDGIRRSACARRTRRAMAGACRRSAWPAAPGAGRRSARALRPSSTTRPRTLAVSAPCATSSSSFERPKAPRGRQDVDRLERGSSSPGRCPRR